MKELIIKENDRIRKEMIDMKQITIKRIQKQEKKII